MRAKVLILVHQIQHYRIPIYNLIAERFDLTVATKELPEFNDEETKFAIIQIPVKKIGPFFIHMVNLFRLAKKFQVVIGLQDLRCIDLMLLGLIPKRGYKLIFWGIGVSASYSKKFDEDKRLDFIRYFFTHKADGLILYSSYPVKKYIRSGYSKDKIFVANNTVKVILGGEQVESVRNIILFVGSLYKEKGILDLLKAYMISYKSIGDKLLDLIIIGEGPEAQEIEKFTIDNLIDKKVALKGAIYNQILLKKYFSYAVVCVSPNQAGLSVLMSMGYSVPFVTSKEAFTGGEIFNISNGVNGIIYENITDLATVLTDVSLNRKKYALMGMNALKHYSENRKPEMMASAIADALDFVLK